MSQIRLTDMAAVPLEVRVGGKLLRLSPPTLADMGELDRFIARQHMIKAREFIESMGDLLPEAGRWEFMEKMFRESQTAMDTARTGTVGDNLAITAYLVYLCAKKNDKEVTFEKVSDWISVPDMVHLGQAMSELTGGKASPEPGSEAAPDTMKSSGA